MQDKRMISGRQLDLNYGETTVVQKLHFDFLELETSVILGPGNSGKSTLIKALAKHLGAHHNPDLSYTGDIYHPGQESCSFMPQEASDPEMNLKQMMQKVSPRLRAPESHIKKHWKGFPNVVDLLKTHLETPYGKLPRPVKKLVLMMVTLFENQPLMLLDEPDAGSSLDSLAWIIEKIKRLHGKKTIIIVTHNLRLAKETADYAMLMAYGNVIETGRAEVFFTNPSHSYTQYVIRMGC